jgi:hypothetical protein
VKRVVDDTTNAAFAQISKLPFYFDAYATNFPSGEIAGFICTPGSNVSCVTVGLPGTEVMTRP